ncbi:hypothetical protein [Hyphomicrobium sp.]|uniref:hypothetical protein n=1 Tax=Hyphomicrobium sp. TaxID=82 RepID=UPI002E365366|nr:hypothetical protein [Hyphomicrobium sp.]HEX2842036.1 hypothetical protein [Hyphomicrobium sp.]
MSQPRDGGFRRYEGVKGVLDGVGGLGWSVIGFILGAMFWHFVGFWGFVSEVVLAGGPIAAIERRAAEPAHRKSQVDVLPQWVQVAEASAPACTLLALDRQTGHTSARPCDADHVALPADVSLGREDRLPVTGGADASAAQYVGAASSP